MEYILHHHNLSQVPHEGWSSSKTNGQKVKQCLITEELLNCSDQSESTSVLKQVLLTEENYLPHWKELKTS